MAVHLPSVYQSTAVHLRRQFTNRRQLTSQRQFTNRRCGYSSTLEPTPTKLFSPLWSQTARLAPSKFHAAHRYKCCLCRYTKRPSALLECEHTI
jgi:hypothetical protein